MRTVECLGHPVKHIVLSVTCRYFILVKMGISTLCRQSRFQSSGTRFAHSDSHFHTIKHTVFLALPLTHQALISLNNYFEYIYYFPYQVLPAWLYFHFLFVEIKI